MNAFKPGKIDEDQFGKLYRSSLFWVSLFSQLFQCHIGYDEEVTFEWAYIRSRLVVVYLDYDELKMKLLFVEAC